MLLNSYAINKICIRQSPAAFLPAAIRVVSLAFLSLVAASAAIANSTQQSAQAHTAFFRGNFADALRLAEPLARRGDAKAQALMTRMSYDGLGVFRDRTAARSWAAQAAPELKKLAAQGDATARAHLSLLSYVGVGTEVDRAEAFKQAELSAKQGDGDGQYLYGIRLLGANPTQEEMKNSNEWVARAARQGNIFAENRLARAELFGWGMTKDQPRALQKLKALAERGLPFAQFQYAYAHHYGIGVPVDFAVARSWYEKAAAFGHPTSLNNLGAIYSRGDGLRENAVLAGKLFEKAAAQGDALGQANLSAAYARGLGVFKDAAKSYELASASAAQNHPMGQFRLGWAFENGEGVAKDMLQALAWYRKAAAQGNQSAQTALKRLTGENPSQPTRGVEQSVRAIGDDG